MALERARFQHFSRKCNLQHPPLGKQSAFTLPELLVAMFLSGLLLTLLVQLFSIGFRVSQEEMERSKAETAAVIVIKKLSADLASSNPSALSLSSTGDKIVIHPVLSITSRRQLVFEDKLFYWSYDSTSKTLFKSEYLTPPSGAFNTLALRLDQATLTALPSTGSNRTVQKISNVSAFSVSNPSGVTAPNVGSPLTVDLEILIDRAETRNVVSLTRVIWLASGSS
jgi:prepilin-type N-terminal cleavage/methylation domain-containing protein